MRTERAWIHEALFSVQDNPWLDTTTNKNIANAVSPFCEVSVRFSIVGEDQKGKFLAKVDHCNKTKLIKFGLGPSVKYVLHIIDAFSKKREVKLFVIMKDKLGVRWVRGRFVPKNVSVLHYTFLEEILFLPDMASLSRKICASPHGTQPIKRLFVFLRPRYTWGLIYGSECLSVREVLQT